MTSSDRSNRPEIRRTSRSLPIALLRARETVMGPIREMLAQSGINEQKWRVLRVLDEEGPMEQTALAARACLLLSSLTRILKTMEGEGLLSREADRADRRKSIVSVTDKGRGLIRTHLPEAEALFAALTARYGAERMEELLDLLEELHGLEG
ncbi:homoprotocatechuate degradation operon regulator HpaR [Nioella sp. MMSF_3534]|jgi:homoprotocatechuate degradation regulator HpaR|uniref:homoprotocatechuate degradation operon regulator HpaR n=1 Tax=Nioella sp. MMSF_3534 TaxID=3046720 RepID=UPI00273F3B8D|nr:homoprotocatechuate degradation operon regulator HpaR [Nioella sp. MMSF_3534]